MKLVDQRINMPKLTFYKLTLVTSGYKYEMKGKTILDALNKIPLEWNDLKAKGTITVSQGKLSYEHLFYLRPLRRLLANKLNRLMWGKRLQILLETQT